MRKISFMAVVVFFVSGLVSFALAQEGGSPSAACGIENCHGLDISCGPNVPKECTMLYAFGDRCRQFARCEIVAGKCCFVENDAFKECKRCIQKCKQYTKEDVIKSFECESQCVQ